MHGQKMRIFRHYAPLPGEAKGAVVTVGNFDGVHRGHQAVIEQAGRIARESNRPRAVVTFEPHPRKFFRPGNPPFRLTPLRIKAHCIEGLGVDHLLVLHFDRMLAELSPEDFVARVLVSGLACAHVVVGTDFVFGKGRAGNAELLSRLARRSGFGFTAMAQVAGANGEIYSSTRIREYLKNGRPGDAAALLGRVWEIEGRVVPGDARGRHLGFPTANIELGEFLRPGHGIYAVRAGVDKGAETSWHDAVASFGTRPATGGGPELFEVHLFDFSGDLYGKHLRVALVEYLRPQSDFDSLEALSRQMAEDARLARAILSERSKQFRAAEKPVEDSMALPRNGTRP